MGSVLYDNLEMSEILSIRQIVAKNLIALMLAHNDIKLEKLGAKAGRGHGTIGRMKKCETSATIDVIADVAKALKIEPWQLLHPKMTEAHLAELDVIEAQLLQRYRASDDLGKDVIRRILGTNEGFGFDGGNETAKS